MSRSHIVNFALYQLAWLTCVVGASKHMPWLGVQVAIVVWIWHITQCKNYKTEIQLMFACVAIGGLCDQALLSSGLVTYISPGWSPAWVPAWILGLWLVFSTLLNVSLRWLHGRYLIGALLGALGGPLAYIGAEKMGAVRLHGHDSLIALSLAWVIITPILLNIAARYDGFAELAKESA